ncbi:hypothetical protein NPIL_387091, partial [Nephila pilipes]
MMRDSTDMKTVAIWHDLAAFKNSNKTFRAPITVIRHWAHHVNQEATLG